MSHKISIYLRRILLTTLFIYSIENKLYLFNIYFHWICIKLLYSWHLIWPEIRTKKQKHFFMNFSTSLWSWTFHWKKKCKISKNLLNRCLWMRANHRNTWLVGVFPIFLTSKCLKSSSYTWVFAWFKSMIGRRFLSDLEHSKFVRIFLKKWM